MSAVLPDYDSDPGRWRSWASPRDAPETVASELRGPAFDIGCGEGRLASSLLDGVRQTGVDSSLSQLTGNPYRPTVQADMRADNGFWCGARSSAAKRYFGSVLGSPNRASRLLSRK